MSWNVADQRMGVVISVLSGDSFLIKFCGQDGPNYNVIHFPFTYAPSVSVVDNSREDENIGFIAWNFLREQIVGKRVLIGASLPISEHPITIIQLFDTPVSYSKISLADEPEFDLELMMLQNGFTRVREMASVPEEFKVDYQKYVNFAKDLDAGAWGKSVKPRSSNRQQKEIHPFTHKEMLENCEMKVVVTVTCDDNFLIQVITENNDRFVVELAGVCHPNIPTSTPIVRNLFGMFFVENMLTKQFLLRIHCKTAKGYLGTLSTGGRNIAGPMISKGLVRFNEMTSSYLSNPHQLRVFEYNAKKQGRGIWADCGYSIKNKEPFHATVVSIPSSNTVNVINKDGDEIVYHLSGIHVPEFDFDHKSEPLGYEAWLLMRDTLLGKEVYVTVDDERMDKQMATIRCGDICINELLARRGLAELSISRVRKNPSCLAEIHNAFLAAQEEQIGLFSPNKPTEGVEVHEISEEEKEQLMADESTRTFQAIVIDVTGPVYMRLFNPETASIINVSLVSLVPLAPTEWTSRRARELLRAYFINHNVDVYLTRLSEHSRYFRAIVYNSSDHFDARILPLRYGFVRFNSNVSDDTSDKGLLEQCQEEARANGRGIYKNESRSAAPISKDKTTPVIVTKVVDETTLAVQNINEITNRLSDILRITPFQPLDLNPRADDYVILERNGIKHRAQVIRTRGPEVYVYLLDFGLSVWAFVSDLRQYSEELLQYQPTATLVSLAFVKPFTHHSQQFRQAAINYINNIFSTGTEVYIRRPYDRELPNVQVFMEKESSTMTLQYALVNDGIVQVSEDKVHHSFIPSVNELNKVMLFARQNQIGGWSLNETE